MSRLEGQVRNKTAGSAVTSYTYSTRGELLSASLPDGRTISYVYDPLGRRIAKKVNGTTTEKYLWSGLTRLLAVYDGSDNLVMSFDYADARVPYSLTRFGLTYYLVYDQVGTLKVVLDSVGAVVKRVDYDSFGNVLSDSAPAFTAPFGFAGGLVDRDTGLVKFGYRDYDPNTGRWTAKDPIRFDGGDVDLYGYCLYDPINFIDEAGLSSVGGFGWVIQYPDTPSSKGCELSVFILCQDDKIGNKINPKPFFCEQVQKNCEALQCKDRWEWVNSSSCRHCWRCDNGLEQCEGPILEPICTREGHLPPYCPIVK